MRSSELKIARDIKELLWVVIEMRKNVPKHISYGMLDRVQDTIDKEAYAECFVARVNSYIGYMIHHKSYAIRRRVLSLRSTDWNRYIYVRGRHRALVLRPRYRVRNKQKQVLYEFSNKQMCAE